MITTSAATDIIQCAKNKLNDPIIMSWALRIYEDTKKHNPESADEMLQTWFDDLTLSQLMRSDAHDCLSHMFNIIPTDRFRNVHNAIMEQYSYRKK